MLHTMSISKSSLYPLLLFCFVWCKSKITKTEIAILHRMYVQLKYDRLIKFCADWFLMRFVYGALLLIASITPKTFIGLKLYKYAPNKYFTAILYAAFRLSPDIQSSTKYSPYIIVGWPTNNNTLFLDNLILMFYKSSKSICLIHKYKKDSSIKLLSLHFIMADNV